MAINKISQEKINQIKQKSVITLPNQPKISAEELKERFVKPVVDTNNSTVAEINRIVDEINDDILNISEDLTEHNTNETAHENIREEIGVLSNAFNTHKHDSLYVPITTGKDLISTTEIARLALVDNYDDTAVKQQITDDIATHNNSETAHTFLKGKIDEAKAIAEGKSRARVFATKSALDTWLLDSENVALLQIGDNFYIEETDKPDYWWNGTTIKELETQKVDLTDYYTKTEVDNAISTALNNLLGGEY